MIDASAGFMKDGPKNRLRAQDIHRIVDVFNKAQDVPRCARLVSFNEIEKNEFNLNLPRYIDSQTPEDRQDIEGHLKGGIPVDDIDALQRYWDVCPGLRKALVKKNRPGYMNLALGENRTAIKAHSPAGVCVEPAKPSPGRSYPPYPEPSAALLARIIHEGICCDVRYRAPGGRPPRGGFALLAPRLLTVCPILLRRSSLRLPAIGTVSNVSLRFLMNNPG